MTTHSPTPWRFGISNYRCLKDHGFGPNRGHGTGSVGGCDYQFQGWEEDGHTLSCEATKLAVAVFDDTFEPASADAEFILRAVNCHDELVDLLKYLLAEDYLDSHAYARVEAMIAKAEAK